MRATATTPPYGELRGRDRHPWLHNPDRDQSSLRAEHSACRLLPLAGVLGGARGAFAVVHTHAVASTIIVVRAIISVAIFIAVIGASALVAVALLPVRAAEQRPAIPHLRQVSPGEPGPPTS